MGLKTSKTKLCGGANENFSLNRNKILLIGIGSGYMYQCTVLLQRQWIFRNWIEI